MSEGDSVYRIKDLLGDAGRRLGLPSAVETGLVWSRWNEIVGSAVAAHAEPSSLKAGVLRVRADSPTWATEIAYLGDEIRASVNRTVGAELVHEVRIWTGPGRVGAGQGSSSANEPATRATRPAPNDPREAFERAREAWSRALGEDR
jgi:predicted nucleic acid-binding Zn ribbon protein